MSIATLRDALPSYAADLGANLDELADDRELSAEERWGCFVACAWAAGEPRTIRELLDGAAESLGERGAEAAKSAAAITAMNNIYYGAIGSLKNGEYMNMTSHLHMDGLARPSVDKTVFELWCLAVSTLNGCGPCLDAQEEELRRRAVPPSRVQAAMRIAAVTGAVARILAAEAAAEGDGSGSGEAPDGDGSPDGGAKPEDAPDAPADERGEATSPPLRTRSPEELARTPHPAPAPEGITPG